MVSFDIGRMDARRAAAPGVVHPDCLGTQRLAPEADPSQGPQDSEHISDRRQGPR